jgi:RNA recognition motif-containing protein
MTQMTPAQMQAMLEALGTIPQSAADTQSAEPGFLQQQAQQQPRPHTPPPQLQAQPQPNRQHADHDGNSNCAVRLRGLPFQSNEQDVLAFFAKHDVVESIAEDRNAVRIITKASGKPSGQAVVLMQTQQDAHVAMQVLNGQYMGTRYIEVFLHNEDSGKESANAGANAGPVSATGGTSTPAHGGMATKAMAPSSHEPLARGPVPAGPVPSMPYSMQPPGQHVKASPDQMCSASLFDGAGDTGGSGGATPMVMTPWDNRQWWGATPSPGGPGPVNVAGLQMAQAMPVAGTGDGGNSHVVRKEGDEEVSWEELFDWLKRDNVEPPMPSAAALNGLGTSADLGGGVGAREPLQGNGRQLNSM